MVRIVDWAGNVKYEGQTFLSIQDAWDFLTEDQRERHPNVTDEEFAEIMGEFATQAV